MKQLMKRWLALGMSFAMAFTMIPAGSGDVVKAEETTENATSGDPTSPPDPAASIEDPYKDSLLAAYDFDVDSAAANTTIPDVSGNGKNAAIKGTGAAVADGILTLPGGAAGSSAAYVDIPGSVFENQDTLTISVWLKNETGSGNYAAMSFGTPTAHIGGGDADLPLNYWILNPAQPEGKFKSVRTKSDNAGAPYNTETAVSDTKTDANWRMYTTVITENEIIGYYDGKEVSRSTAAAAEKYKKISEFGTGLYACIGRSGYNDKFYKGGVYDVRVYKEAFSQEGINYLYNRGKLGFDKTALDLGDTSAVTGNLTLPARGKNGSAITWRSDMPSVISDAGVVTRPQTEENAIVTLTATLELGGLKVEKTFKVTVLSGSVKGRFEEQVSKFNLGYSIATEDLTLPNKIETEGVTINIDWKSSDSAITIDKSGNEIIGKVTQPENTLMVTLTATFTCTNGEKNYEDEKEFIVCVRKAATVAKTAIATYDFADFTASGTDKLTSTKDGNTVELKLESVGEGKKPELKNDADRGMVLSLTQQDYDKRGFALLPENPFAGKSVDNGFTLSFWTKSTANPGGNRCLVDFEIAPAANNKRAGTLAVNQQMMYWNTTDQNDKFTDFGIGDLNLTPANGWTMVTMAVTKTGIAFYRNGSKINHSVSGTADYDQMIKDLAGAGGIGSPEQTKVRLGASLATYWHCAGALLDDVSFYDKALSGDEVAGLFEETLVDKDFVALESIALKASSDSVMKDETIQLTVTPTPANSSVTRPVTWDIADTTVVSVDADGVLTGLKAGTTTIKATVAGVKSDAVTITVKEPVESLKAGYWLAVYSTTTPFYASAGNLEQETRSVYMAVSKDGKSFEVLNNGGGVIFASKGSRQITSPRIYKAAKEGKDIFTVVAPDFTASRGVHIFTSEDGINYYDDTLADSDEREALPLSKKSFKLLLNGNNILDTDKAITLGNAVELTEEQYKHVIDKLGTVVNNGLQPLETLKITSEQSGAVTEAVLHETYPNVDALYSDGSKQNFKIDWSGALDNVDLTTAGDHTITGKVVQTKYENNLKALNGSKLPEDDPANVPANEGEFPDNYDPETGTVYYDSTKFIEGMADPRIYWDEETQYYYMTASYFPEEGDQIDANEKLEQYDRVVLRRGRTLEELQTRHGNQITVWKVGNQPFVDKNDQDANGSRYIWAPEIHRVGNYWVIYFTESHGNGLFNIYCHALVLDGDKDPYDTALTASDGVSEWKDYKMRLASGVNGTDPFDTSFCLDMTYFEDGDTSYVSWPGKPSIGNTDIYIAKVNKERPWEITSAASVITQPEYGWERVRAIVNEGPTVLQHDGKIFMCYSGAGTGSEYAIGMLSAESGADLLNPASWTKSPYPLLTSRDVNGEEGPGHNSFTVDKDGNDIFVYHARPTSHNYQKCGWDGTKSTYNNEPLNDPCRHARLKRVHWAADGTPILKMTYENELVDDYKTVSLTINVGEGGSELVVPVSKVTLDKDELILHEGESDKLTATVEPDNATHKELTWESDNPSVAIVAEDGTVTAKSEGTAIITATAASEESASCEVIVVRKGAPIVAVTKITLNKESVSLKEGETETLTATVEPDDATDQTVDWNSADETIATVDQNGKITAVKAGETTITAKAGDKTAQCDVIVTKDGPGGEDPDDKVPVTGITLNKTTLSLKVNASETLTATVTPANATDKNVTWSSSDSSVAKVENGKVTALKAGAAVITAKAGGKEAKCTVTVTADSTGGNGVIELKGIKLNKKSLKLGVKETFTLKATLEPANTTIKTKNPSWKSSNKKVVTVNNKGKITAKRKGTATITASIGKIKATCKVTVCAAPTKIKLKKTKINLKKGKTAQISVKSFTPKKAYCSSFTYKVKSKKIATVSSTGKIKAKKKGTTTITVTCKNNKKAKATVKVIVK